MSAPKPVWIAALGLLAVFYAATCWLVMRPVVAEDYRAYYIDNTSPCPPKATPGRGLGVVELAADKVTKATDDTLQCGWSHYEAGATWTNREESRLVYTLTPEQMGQALVLSIVASPFVAGDIEGQPVEVLVNGELVGTMAFVGTEVQTVALKIGGQYTKAARLTMVLKFANAAAPADFGASDDSRTLALSVRTISLTLADDWAGAATNVNNALALVGAKP